MSETKFWPGPWEHTDRFIYGRDPLGYRLRLAEVFNATDGIAVICKEYHAALIAAAPDLYAALDAALPFLISHPNDAGMSRHDLAVAALAKARGET
jgi:hypothetical protein